ncbi:uncharacterized protein LOC101242431 [Ciona intestinalis]
MKLSEQCLDADKAVFSSKALDALLDNEVESLQQSFMSELADAQSDVSKIKYVTPTSQCSYVKTLESALQRKSKTPLTSTSKENEVNSSSNDDQSKRRSNPSKDQSLCPVLKPTFNLSRVRKSLEHVHHRYKSLELKGIPHSKRQLSPSKVQSRNVQREKALKKKLFNLGLERKNKVKNQKVLQAPNKNRLSCREIKKSKRKQHFSKTFVQPVSATIAQFSMTALHLLSRWNKLEKDYSPSYGAIEEVSTEFQVNSILQEMTKRNLRKRKHMSILEEVFSKKKKKLRVSVKPRTDKFLMKISGTLSEHAVSAVKLHILEKEVSAFPKKNNQPLKVEDLILDLEELPQIENADFAEEVDVTSVSDGTSNPSLLNFPWEVCENEEVPLHIQSEILIENEDCPTLGPPSLFDTSCSTKAPKISYPRVKYKRKVGWKKSSGKIRSKQVLRSYRLYRLNAKVRLFKSLYFPEIPVSLARHKKVPKTTSVTICKHKLQWREIKLYNDTVLLPQVFTISPNLNCQFSPKETVPTFGCTAARCRGFGNVTTKTIKSADTAHQVVPPTEKQAPFPIMEFGSYSTASGISIIQLVNPQNNSRNKLHVIKVMSTCDWSICREKMIECMIQSHNELRKTQRGKYTCTSVDGFCLEVLRVQAFKVLGRNITVQVKKALNVPPTQQISLVKISRGGHKEPNNFASTVMNMLELDEDQSAPFQSFLGIFTLKDRITPESDNEVYEDVPPEPIEITPTPPKPTTKRFQLGTLGCLNKLSNEPVKVDKLSKLISTALSSRSKSVTADDANSKKVSVVKPAVTTELLKYVSQPFELPQTEEKPAKCYTFTSASELAKFASQVASQHTAPSIFLSGSNIPLNILTCPKPILRNIKKKDVPQEPQPVVPSHQVPTPYTQLQTSSHIGKNIVLPTDLKESSVKEPAQLQPVACEKTKKPSIKNKPLTKLTTIFPCFKINSLQAKPGNIALKFGPSPVATAATHSESKTTVTVARDVVSNPVPSLIFRHASKGLFRVESNLKVLNDEKEKSVETDVAQQQIPSSASEETVTLPDFPVQPVSDVVKPKQRPLLPKTTEQTPPVPENQALPVSGPVNKNKIDRNCKIRASVIEDTRLTKSENHLQNVLNQMMSKAIKNVPIPDPPLLNAPTLNIPKEENPEGFEDKLSDVTSFSAVSTQTNFDSTDLNDSLSCHESAELSGSDASSSLTDNMSSIRKNETMEVEQVDEDPDQVIADGNYEQNKMISWYTGQTLPGQEEIDICGEFDTSLVAKTLKKRSREIHSTNLATCYVNAKKKRKALEEEVEEIREGFQRLVEDKPEKDLTRLLHVRSEKMRRAALREAVLRLSNCLYRPPPQPHVKRVVIQATKQCVALKEEYEKNQKQLASLKKKNAQLMAIVLELSGPPAVYNATIQNTAQKISPVTISNKQMIASVEVSSRRKKQVFVERREEPQTDPSIITSAAKYLARISEE